MRRSQGSLARLVVAGACLVMGTATALAQGRGGGPGGMDGGPMGGPPPAGGLPPPPGQRGQAPDSRAGFHFGPPGRWWDNREFAAALKLRPEQQARMDAIFEQNRLTLQSRFAAVQQAESRMEELSRSSTPDEAALFAQIDRVSEARAELEKANTHMLLQIRKEMDGDQIKRLEDHR